MKKSFSKKLMILAFAFGGLFMIGNNVFATDPNDGEDPGDDGSGSYTVECYGRGEGPGIGYYYCSSCDWVKYTDPDYHTGASTCTKTY